jgi:hypothetical protein
MNDGAMDNNQQSLTYVNTYIVQKTNFYIGQWKPKPHRTTD